MVKPLQSDPAWAKESIRRLQWQALLIWLVTFVVAIGVITVAGRFSEMPRPWLLALVLPQVFLFGCIGWAYRQGIRDSEEHSRNT